MQSASRVHVAYVAGIYAVDVNVSTLLKKGAVRPHETEFLFLFVAVVGEGGINFFKKNIQKYIKTMLKEH